MTEESFHPIKKIPVESMTVKPNLDLNKTYENFTWESMYDELDWLPGGGLNMAHEAIDRHANGTKKNKIALIWEGKNGENEEYTFGDLQLLTNKFANVLTSLGIVKGDRVFIFMDR